MKEYLELYKEMLFQALETQEDDEYQWYMLDIKDVLDPDGWSDTYSVWVGYPKNEDDDSIDITNPYYVCIFGDDPTNSYKDWECDSYEEAIEFFTFYGEDEYDDSDELYASCDIESSIDEKLYGATDIVNDLYIKFPKLYFIYERDVGDNQVDLYFEFNKKDVDINELEDYIKDTYKSIGYGINRNGRLKIRCIEDGDEDSEITSSSNVEKEFDEMGNDEEYWYYTRHGVGPGSVPKGLGIERYAYDDDDPYGEYFSVRGKTIRPKAMKYYDIKEKIPKNIR